MRKIISGVTFLFILLHTTFAFADLDTTGTSLFNQKITNIQSATSGLPSGVSEPKGQIGAILSTLFNSSGQIPNVVLKALGTRADGRVLRWVGGNGGSLQSGTIWDTGTSIGIGSAPSPVFSTSDLRLDVNGKIGATNYCDEAGQNCFTAGQVNISAGTIGGGGTTNFIPKYTGATTLGNSLIQDNGTIVSVGGNVSISGQAILSTEGTAANHLVTKGYVDTAITSLSGGASIDSLSDGVSDNSSVYLGYVSGNADDGGNQNTGLGVSALRYNTSGLQNTSVGLNSMYYNNIGSYNTALGRSALQNNTSGSYNTAIGRYSQLTTTTGANNTSLGALSLDGNTTGYNNTAVGRSALGANTTGYNNVGVGMYAMDANTTGFGNVSLGYDSLGSVTSGDDNVGIGDNAGDALTTGNRNIMIGSNVSAPNPTGSDQINIGDTIFGNRANGSLITTRQGIKGNYSSTQIQGIWSIGDGYGVDTSGTNDFGTQYGMVYAHTNAGTSPSLGGKKPVTGQGHQILFTSAGVTTSMISLGTGDAMFAGDVTADNVATACVGSCSGTTPPAAGNYVVNGSLTTTGNATIGGNLSAANFYDEAPSATAYIQTGLFSSASFTAFATAGRLAYTTVVVPSGQTRQYRVSAKTMGYPTDGAGYMFVRIWCTTGGSLDYDYEYGNAVGWEGMELEGYVSLGAGTHTCYLETYGGASNAVYTATYHANSSYTNIRMWPLQG